MNRSLLRQILVLALGLAVAAGMGVATVQAGDMAVQMATASHMDGSGQGDCGGCDATGTGASAVSCTPACAAPASAATLPQAWVMTIAMATDLPARYGTPLSSWITSLDPAPPKHG